MAVSFRRLLLVASISSMFVLATIACQSGDEDPGGEPGIRFPIAATEARVEAGTGLYSANCASCHGTPGISRPTVPTAPAHDETGHTWHHADRLLFEWILDRPPLAETMPAFRGVLNEDEILSILAYIKSTWPDDIRQFQMEGALQYEQQVRETS